MSRLRVAVVYNQQKQTIEVVQRLIDLLKKQTSRLMNMNRSWFFLLGATERCCRLFIATTTA